MITMPDNARKGIAFALGTAIIGSTTSAASKLIAHEVPAPVVVFIQFGICLAIILPGLLRRGTGSLHSAHWKTHLIRGLGGWLGFFALYSALGSIPLVDATLLRNTAPLFVPLVALIWAGTLVPLNRWPSLLVGFAGVAIILRPQPGAHGLDFAYLLALSSGLFLAISMVGTRLLSRWESSSKIMFYYFALSFVLSLPLAIWHWQPIPLKAWPWLLYIGFSIFITMWLYTKAYTYAHPSIVSPISYFTVVFSGLIGWSAWGHLPDAFTFTGIALVVCAGIYTIYLGSLTDRQATHSDVRK